MKLKLSKEEIDELNLYARDDNGSITTKDGKDYEMDAFIKIVKMLNNRTIEVIVSKEEAQDILLKLQLANEFYCAPLEALGIYENISLIEKLVDYFKQFV